MDEEKSVESRTCAFGVVAVLEVGGGAGAFHV